MPWACPSGFWPAGLSSWLNSGPASLLQSCLATTGLRLVLAIVTGRTGGLRPCQCTMSCCCHLLPVLLSLQSSPLFLLPVISLQQETYIYEAMMVKYVFFIIFPLLLFTFLSFFLIFWLFFFNFSFYAYLCGCSLMFFHEGLVFFSFLNTDSLSFLLFFLHLLVFWVFLHSAHLSYNILSVFPAFSLSGALNFLHFIECETVWASVSLWKVLRDGLCIACLVLVNGRRWVSVTFA